MTMAPHAGLSHPLVVAYLGDLERALASADAQERLDTITAVTEHLTDALGGWTNPTTEQVRAVLDELGSVEQIATATTPAPAVLTDEPPRGQWTAPVLLAASFVSLAIPFFGALLAIGCLVTAIVLLRGGAPRRGLLRATIAVSSVTLLVTAVLAVGTLAWSTVTVSTDSQTGGPVVVSTTGP